MSVINRLYKLQGLLTEQKRLVAEIVINLYRDVRVSNQLALRPLIVASDR